jgi:hypothetical protein
MHAREARAPQPSESWTDGLIRRPRPPVDRDSRRTIMAAVEAVLLKNTGGSDGLIAELSLEDWQGTVLLGVALLWEVAQGLARRGP